MKKAVSIAARLAISGLLLWWLFRDPALRGKILPHLASLRQEWPWTLAGIGLAGASIVFSAWRWWVILHPQVPAVTFGSLLRITLCAGFFNITSLGTLGGDAYRVIAINELHPGTVTAAGVSVMVDHIVGVVATAVLFFMLGFAALHQWHHFAPGVQDMLKSFSIFLIIMSVGMILSILSLTPGFINWSAKYIPRLSHSSFVLQMSRTFEPLWKNWRSGVAAVGISLGLMLTFFTSFYCGVRAVGTETPLLPVLVAMPIVDLAAALPVSVSGLGIREKTFETLLAALVGLPKATGVAASLAGWLFSVVWGLFGGLLFVTQSRSRPAAPP